MQNSERKQWWEGERFFRQEELIFRDCDVLGRVRPAALVVMMGSIAGYDYDARGLTYEKLYALRQVFLLSRMSFRLRSYPVAGETVTLSTWENGVKGAHMQRNYEFFRQDRCLPEDNSCNCQPDDTHQISTIKFFHRYIPHLSKKPG